MTALVSTPAPSVISRHESEVRLLTATSDGWDNGGFTITLGGSSFFPGDEDEYIVSLGGAEVRFAGWPSDDDVIDYVERFREQLARPKHYLGGWVQGVEHFLDVSIVVRGREAALAFAARHDQIAIYHPSTGVTVYVDS